MGSKYTSQGVPWSVDLAAAEAKFKPVEARNRRSFAWTFVGTFIGITIGFSVYTWAIHGVLDPLCRTELATYQSLPLNVIRVGGQNYTVSLEAAAAQHQAFNRQSTFGGWQGARGNWGYRHKRYGCVIETNGKKHFLHPANTGFAVVFDDLLRTVGGIAFLFTGLGQLVIRWLWPLKGDPTMRELIVEASLPRRLH
jgi:hypothetical protein